MHPTGMLSSVQNVQASKTCQIYFQADRIKKCFEIGHKISTWFQMKIKFVAQTATISLSEIIK